MSNEIQQFFRDHGISEVEAIIPDMAGVARGKKLAVKSKSMVTEEIKLNAALNVVSELSFKFWCPDLWIFLNNGIDEICAKGQVY